MRIILRVDKSVLEGIKFNNRLSRKIENTLLKASLMQIYSNWSELANKELNTSRANYINSLMLLGGQENRSTGSVSLVGVVNNMIESGCSSFDMKKGFEASSKIRFDKSGGWYLIIPISDKDRAIGILVNLDISNKVRNLLTSLSETQALGPTSQNSGSSTIPKSSAVIGNISRTFEEAKIRSQIFARMPITNQKTANPKFRIASHRSRPDSWIHPGIKARNFKDRAMGKFNMEKRDIVRQVVRSVLEEQGLL